MDLSSITDNGSHSAESLNSVATRSTESLKSSLDLGIQGNQSRQSFLQDKSLEDQFESCVALCKNGIDEALDLAKISTYAKTCFHPIACQLDDELLRLEIWALDFGTETAFWHKFSELVTANVAVGKRLREVFEDLNASLKEIGTEMKLIERIVKDAAGSTQNLNDDWTTRADEAVSRVNGNIDLLSSAVRTFISQRNLTSLEEAIKNEKDPYDGLQYELDDTIDSLHRKRQPIRTVQNEAKDQNRTLPIGLYESSQRKSDKIISSSFDGAASLDDNVDAPEDTSDSKDANIISLHNENYRNSKDSTDLAWKRHNLLSLDGGGIRGYWSLLVLKKLMESIAAEEERIAEEDWQEKAACAEEKDGKKVHHSFWPQPWPDNVSQVPSSSDLEQKIEEANNPEAQRRAIPAAQRYLPCHYFDYICGSSTGSLIAIMLGRFRMPVPDCMLEYENLTAKVFGTPRFFTTLRFGLVDRTKYEATELKKVFQDVTERRNERTGQRRTVFASKPGLCKTFVTSKIKGSGRSQLNYESLHLIRSYDHFRRTSPDQLDRTGSDLTIFRRETGGLTLVSQRADTNASNVANPAKNPQLRVINYGPAQDFEIWEVARAATAAPLYFDPLKIEIPRSKNHWTFTDAGFGHDNNPTKEGTNEIQWIHGNGSIGIVVSVGTARRDEGELKSGLLAFKSKVKELAQKATDTEKVHRDIENMSSNDGFPYYRMDDPAGLKMQLDEWKPKPSRFNGKISGSITLETIRAAFYRWAIQRQDQLCRCAKDLVECRRARSVNRAKWERYATGAEYTCRLQGCQRQSFDNCEEFQQHLERDHGIKMKDRLETEVIECRRDWRYQSAPGLT